MSDRMKRFLRYNTRHRVWIPRGAYGKTLPQLNPIMSSSHGKDGKRTWSASEPLWLFRIRQRLFAYAGRHKCGRRGESFHGRTDKETPDTWDIGPDGNRTCSYCGSIHFDDLMEIARKTVDDDRYGIEGTTKSYKVYVRQPGVRNASEGAIKFYMHHAPANPSNEEQILFAKACRLTNERFTAQYKARMAAIAGEAK